MTSAVYAKACSCSTCPRGDEAQPEWNFYVRASAPDGLQRWCKTCSRAARKQWAEDNRARLNELNGETRERRFADPERREIDRDRKREWVRRKHGITPDRYRVRPILTKADDVDTAPIRDAIHASELSFYEIAQRISRDPKAVERVFEQDRMTVAKAKMILEAVGLAPVDVGL